METLRQNKTKMYAIFLARIKEALATEPSLRGRVMREAFQRGIERGYSLGFEDGVEFGITLGAPSSKGAE